MESSMRSIQSQGLIPPRTCPSLCGSIIRLGGFLGRAHSATPSSSSRKLHSLRRRSRSNTTTTPTTTKTTTPPRIVASLNSGQIMVVVVATASALSFVYLNYFSKRKKHVPTTNNNHKAQPSLGSEIPDKHNNGTHLLTDLTLEDALHVKQAVQQPVLPPQNEALHEKEAHDIDDHHHRHQLHTSGTASDASASLHGDRHHAAAAAAASYKFEPNAAEQVRLPVQLEDVPESGTPVPHYQTQMPTHHENEQNGLMVSNIDHIGGPETTTSLEESTGEKEDLHLFYAAAAEDQSVATVQSFLHAQRNSQAAHSGGHHISPLPTTHTVGMLQPDPHLLDPEYPDQNGSILTKEKATETTSDNFGFLPYHSQRLSIAPTQKLLQKESLPQRLGAYHRFLKYGRLQEGLTMLEEMDKEGVLDMNKVYHSKFLSLCRSQKAVNEAFRFVKLIPNPTLSTFNMLMSVCSSAQDSEGAAKVWQLVQESGFKPDCKLYTTMVSTYGKSGKVDSMFKVFHEMVNSEVEPNLHTYGALIDGCARSGQIAKAFGAYGILRSKKVKPDRVIFNILIAACAQSGAVDRAFGVLQEMREEPHPIDPDHITIGALMKACINVGQVDRVEEVYEMAQQYNIKGTPELYTIAVRSCSQTGDWVFACSIYNDMRKNGVEPDEMFLSTLIDVAGHAGNINAAFEVLQEASLEGMRIGIMPYSALMGACCSTKSWRKALELYKEIKSLSLVPTVTTLNALITVLCEGNQLEKALEVLKEMKNMGLSPNEITYSILFVASEKNDDLDAGLMLLSLTKADNLPLNMVMSKCLIALCSRRFQKSAALGEVTVSFKSGKPQIDNNWASLAVMIYREAIAASMVPSMDVLSQVLGCLQLPANMSLKEKLVELLGVDAEASRSANLFSLIDGFGEYDLRAFSLLEEAASLGIVPCVSFKGNPIMIDARKWHIHIGEVYLLTVLKGLKHRLAAGARLPTVSILLPVEEKIVISPEVEKTTNLAGRVGQAIGAMLRRRGLSYLGNESYGKIRITGRTVRRWFQPKSVSSSLTWKPSEFGLSTPKLGKQIADQQRNIRTENYTLH